MRMIIGILAAALLGSFAAHAAPLPKDTEGLYAAKSQRFTTAERFCKHDITKETPPAERDRIAKKLEKLSEQDFSDRMWDCKMPEWRQIGKEAAIRLYQNQLSDFEAAAYAGGATSAPQSGGSRPGKPVTYHPDTEQDESGAQAQAQGPQVSDNGDGEKVTYPPMPAASARGKPRFGTFENVAEEARRARTPQGGYTLGNMTGPTRCDPPKRWYRKQPEVCYALQDGSGAVNCKMECR